MIIFAVLLLYFISMYRQVDVEPAKTSRSSCKKCKLAIEKNNLRVRVFDDRAFQDYIKKHGR